ncbi:MAG: hypothetical protein K2V38_25820, partial [Gemmataceae bacterium]|nr:hypothetical protein [Gemmataceae bacterium]
QIITLGVNVESPPPLVTVPDSLSVVAGAAFSLPLTVTADSPIASTEWWFSFDGQDYLPQAEFPWLESVPNDPVKYRLAEAGEYQAWVTVTDGNGKTGEGWFTITATNPAPVAQVRAFRPDGTEIGTGDVIDEGTTVTFAVTDLSLDDLDTATLYVDWTGEGVFDQLNTEGVDFRVDPSNPRVVRFDHLFDDDGSRGPFDVTVRYQDEWGASDYDPVRLTVKNVAPTATLARDQRTLIASAMYSGQDVWRVEQGQALELTDLSDPSKTDLTQLTITWTVFNDDARSGTPALIGNDTALKLPDYTLGRVYQVSVTVADKDGGVLTFAPFSVVVGGAGVPFIPGDGHGGPPPREPQPGETGNPNDFIVFGSLLIDGQDAPEGYNRFANAPGAWRDNWDGSSATVRFQLDPVSTTLLAALAWTGVTVRYRFRTELWDVERFSIGPDNHNLMGSSEFYSTSPVYPISAGLLDRTTDRQVVVSAGAEFVRNGAVVGASPFGLWLHAGIKVAGPSAVLTTPYTPTTIGQVVDAYAALRTLVGQLADKGQALVDAVVANR